MSGSKSRDRNKHCSFHEDHGHHTEDCRDLAEEIERLAQKGALKEYEAGGNQGRKGKRKRGRGRCAQDNKRAKDHHDEEDDDSQLGVLQYDGVVSTISGLPPGMTRSKLKAETRRPPTPPADEQIKKRFRTSETITFSEDDPVPTATPHNDALVI